MTQPNRPFPHSPAVLAAARALALALLLALTAAPAGHAANLGKIDFPNSGAAEAQPDFLEGVLYLHNFEYEDAADAFRRAQEIDPGFAMAYWGEAMTHNHPIWMQQDRAAARAVLERLAPTREERLAKCPTERERGYLETLEVLYGEGDKKERDFRYRDALRRLSERYPDDLEAASFYSLSLLGTAHEGRDFAIYMRAAAVAGEVFRRNPQHPGAAHYLIHSFDDPIHAPLGLPAALAYAPIAPDAAHAQHMTSHIFVAMGMWDDVVAANERARDVQDAGLARRGRRPNVCGHYSSWLAYGYLQQGRHAAAAELLDRCQARMAEEPDAGETAYYAAMRARQVLDTGDWVAADRWTAEIDAASRGHHDYVFTSAIAALRRGDVETARQLAESIRGQSDGERGGARDAILDRELEALLTLAAGEGERAVELLRQAAADEEALPYDFGPPATVQPPHELLGQVLLQLGRFDDAVAAFDEQLARTPQRTVSLSGLVSAADGAGDGERATEARAKLAAIWHRADEGVALPAAAGAP